MKKAKLIPTIFKLVKTIRDNFDFFNKPLEGELNLPNQLYMEWDYNLIYDKGITGTHGSGTYIEKPNRLFINQFSFFDTVKQKYPIFEEVVEVIHNELRIEKHQAIFNIVFLVDYLLRNNIHESDESKISEIAVTYSNDLENGRKDFNVKVFMTGIWLEVDQIEVNKELTIRKPVNEDLKQSQPVYYAFPNSSNNLLGCGVVLEIYKRKTNDLEIQEHISRIITALSLFKTGTLLNLRYDVFPDSVLQFENVSHRGFNNTPSVVHYKYLIQPDEVEMLNSFLAEFDKLIESIRKLPFTDVNKPISIAIDRYTDAINRAQQLESKITGSITSFEALYLKSTERTELSHTLSQRAAYVLKQFEFIPIEVYKDLKRAYEIRSTYIHGGVSDPADINGLQNLLDRILTYLRISIVVFLSNSTNSSKEKLIGSVDNAILDDKADKKYSSKLQEFRKFVVK